MHKGDSLILTYQLSLVGSETRNDNLIKCRWRAAHISSWVHLEFSSHVMSLAATIRSCHKQIEIIKPTKYKSST